MRTQSRNLARRPVEALFLRTLLLTAVMVLVVGAGSVWLLLGRTERAMLEEGVRDVRMHAGPALLRAVTAEDAAEPLTGPAYDRVDARVRDVILGPDTVRVKVWNPQGTVVYSSLRDQVGEADPDNAGVRHALAGETWWEASDLPESRFELAEGRLLEVYMPMSWTPGQPPSAVAEVYQRYEPYARIFRSLRRTVFLTGLFVFLTLPIGLYLLYRAGWQGIVVERDLAAQRLREVEGLNALLQRDVAYALDLRESIHSLRQDVLYEPTTPNDLVLHYSFLRRHIGDLATRAETFFEGRPPAQGAER